MGRSLGREVGGAGNPATGWLPGGRPTPGQTRPAELGKVGVVFIGSPTSTAPRSSVSAGADGDARTRDLVLRRVSELGPVTATRLAEEFGMTSAGVRRHLERLDEEGLIAPSETAPARRGRGRPARAYVVTPEGHRSLATGYGDVATEALQFVADRFGEDAVAEFARELLAAMESRYAAIIDATGDDLESRATALAQALAADGYAASARPVGPSGLGLQLCQGHCPMHEVAARFPQFCEEETAVFARLLGVHVQRLATLAGGEHVCTTFVPNGTAAQPEVLGLRPTAADHPERRAESEGQHPTAHDTTGHPNHLNHPHDSTEHDENDTNGRHDEGSA